MMSLLLSRVCRLTDTTNQNKTAIFCVLYTRGRKNFISTKSREGAMANSATVDTTVAKCDQHLLILLSYSSLLNSSLGWRKPRKKTFSYLVLFRRKLDLNFIDIVVFPTYIRQTAWKRIAWIISREINRHQEQARQPFYLLLSYIYTTKYKQVSSKTKYLCIFPSSIQ